MILLVSNSIINDIKLYRYMHIELCVTVETTPKQHTNRYSVLIGIPSRQIKFNPNPETLNGMTTETFCGGKVDKQVENN